MNGGLEVEEIRDAKVLAALAPEWTSLCERSISTPFQRPEWLLPWARQFGSAILARSLRRDGRLVGLLPLVVVDDTFGRRLMPVGVGHSDYLDGIVASDLSAADVPRLLAGLETWGTVELPQLPAHSRLLAMPTPAEWTDDVGEGERCPVLAIRSALPKNMSGNLRYYRRRAERAGVSAMVATRPEEVRPALVALFRLHAARWARRGVESVFADAATREFLHAAADGLAAAGMLRLHVLRLGSRSVAAMLAAAAANCLYVYNVAFDPEMEALGLGSVLFGQAIDAAAAEGTETCDFLRGQEAYKYHWGARDTATFHRTLRRRRRSAA